MSELTEYPPGFFSRLLPVLRETPSELSVSDLASLGDIICSMDPAAKTLSSILRQLLERGAFDELKTLKNKSIGTPHAADADLLFNLALVCDRTRENQEGLACLNKAMLLEPDVAMYHNNSGVFLERLGRYDEAYDAYSKAMLLDPDASLHSINLAKLCLRHLPRTKEGMRHYNYALALDFTNTDVILGSANAFQGAGFYQQAADRARLSILLEPTHIATIFAKPSYYLTISYTSTADLLDRRAGLVSELDRVENEVSIALATPGYASKAFSITGWQTLFLLAYQGKNDLDIMRRHSQQMARALSAFFPDDINLLSPVKLPERMENKKIRVGFCTAFFCHHSVWKIPLHGFYTHLDRERFEIHSFHMEGLVDFATDEVKRLSDSYFRTEDLTIMTRALREAKLDILIFPEFGMNVPTYLLSVMRFAPVQCQALGHPTTSGSDTIDFVLSSDLMEPPGAQDYYSEALVRLPGLGVTYTYPYQHSVGRKEEFDLSSDDIVFISPQSTFKYLPENDDIYPAIASQIPKAKFVFIAPSNALELAKFKARLSASFAELSLDSRNHVLFLPSQGQAGFMMACNMADIFIDNPSWSGHNTTLDALHSHTQVVTLRGDAMRKNHGSALLTHLGLHDYIAYSKQQFIQKCVYFAKSEAERKKFAEAIPRLLARFKDLAPVRALEDFMETQYQRVQSS